MDRIEKLKFKQSIENYFEENRVYELFEKLLKELIISKPNDPINYMINRIKSKDTKRIFITGHPGTSRKEISLSLAESFGYSCVSLGDLLSKEVSKKLDNARKIEGKMNHFNLVDDETVIDLLKKELIRLETENVSYIIEGFPRNRVQAMFLQNIGLLPDNLILLSTTRSRAEERINEKLTGEDKEKHAVLSVDETDLNLDTIKEIYKGFYSEINVSEKKTDLVIEEIAVKILFII